MKTEYEQLEIDTRSELEKALFDLTAESVEDALTLIQKNCDTSSDNLMPQTIRNRYEAYGVAAEQTAGIDTAVKTIKKDVQGLLDTLPDPNKSAVEATGEYFQQYCSSCRKTHSGGGNNETHDESPLHGGIRQANTIRRMGGKRSGLSRNRTAGRGRK